LTLICLLPAGYFGTGSHGSTGWSANLLPRVHDRIAAFGK
jgi:hypothetical protein